MTKRTSGLLMPMPKAMVATTTGSSSLLHRRCTAARAAPSRSAWYAAAATPPSLSAAATASHSRFARQYAIPDGVAAPNVARTHCTISSAAFCFCLWRTA